MAWMKQTTYPHQRRNVVLNVMDGGAWFFAISLVSANTILPVFARHLTSSPLIIGLIPAVLDFGWYVPQLFTAPYVERARQHYRLVLVLGLIERVPFVLLALAFALFPQLASGSRLGLVLFLGLLALRACGSGIVATAWQEFIAHIIPPESRGRFFSMQQFLGNVLGLGGAALAGWLLGHYPFPTNYTWCFAGSAIGVAISWLCIVGSREPEQPPPVPVQVTGTYRGRLGTILRKDRNFRLYLLTRASFYLSTMALGFLAVAAVERFGLRDDQAAVFTTLVLGGSLASNLAWGTIADRLGYKTVLALTTIGWIGTLVLAAMAPNVWFLYVVFALVGATSAGTSLADLGMVMELGPVAERPTYIGLARTLTAPFLALAPLLGGLVARLTSYQTLFWFALPWAFVSLAVLYLVAEPACGDVQLAEAGS